MAKLNVSETRVLRRGGTILRQRRNPETEEIYDVEVKLSWDRLYYRIPGGVDWHSTPKEARIAVSAAG